MNIYNFKYLRLWIRKIRFWTCKMICSKIGYHYEEIKCYCDKLEYYYKQIQYLSGKIGY